VRMFGCLLLMELIVERWRIRGLPSLRWVFSTKGVCWMKKCKTKYTGKDVKVLRDAAHVRKRPAMYIGDTSTRGMHHMIWEAVDNCIDETMMGHCGRIVISVDGRVITVTDNGRGIPVDLHPTENLPTLQVVMTMIGAGGKFGGKVYQASGGTHGVGISVVCALSVSSTVTVRRGGKKYRQKFSRGKATSKLMVVGKCPKSVTGTTIEFEPDEKVFGDTVFESKLIDERARELAYLNAGLSVVFKCAGKKTTYCYSGGIQSFVDHLSRGRDALHDTVYVTKDEGGTSIAVAFRYNVGFSEETRSYVNNIGTVEGGTHLSGFRQALTRVISAAAKNGSKKKATSIRGDDTKEGLVAVVSVRVVNPQFEGQTKTKLGNRDVQKAVSRAVGIAVKEHFEEHPKVAKAIVGKALLAAESREAARQARDLTRKKKGASQKVSMKLADCLSKIVDERELFVVEGDCFAPDTGIKTENGVKRIDAIAIGDKVLTHRNRFMKVTGKSRTRKRKRCRVKIGEKVYTCSDDHEFLVLRDGGLLWIMVKDFSETDMIAMF